MKCKAFIFILLVITVLILPGLVFSAQKSVIVGFYGKPGPSEKALIHGAKGIIKKTYNLIPAMAVSLPEEEIANIKKSKNVAYVEEDGIFSAVDPLLGDEYTNSWGVLYIGSDIAHASGNKGTGVRVAVIDTGIDYTHEDLDANYRGGYDFVFNDLDPMDENGHGTHVAGIIAAEQNGSGVVGIAPEAELYAVRVLDGAGFGLVSWIISGIEWAVMNQMDILNFSLEGPHFLSLQDACDNAYNAGVLLVAAGGNTYGNAVRFPAAYDSVIAVTATDSNDIRSYISPIGPEVELSAPGVDIMSTVLGGSYDFLSGTSQAAPHVTGTAALFILSNQDDLNNDGILDNYDVRLKLQATAIDLGMIGVDDVYGFGLVNAAAASLPISGPIYLTITRTSGSPANNTDTVSLEAGSVYEVAIDNNNLKKVKIDVFKGNVYQEDLSSSYNFAGKKPQEVTFYIDATWTTYKVDFTPYGKSGAFADITITKVEVNM